MVDSTDDVIRQAGSVSQSSIETSATNAPSETLIASVKEAFGKELLQLESNHGDLIIRVTKAGYAKAAKITNEELDCDFLSFVSAIDFMPMPVNEDDFNREAAQPTQPKEQTVGVGGGETRFQVFSHVQSTTKHFGITIKVDVCDDPNDWHERETWEMYGIDFIGHPEIRHLYLPGEFEGFPLRKDFPLLARVVKPWPGLTDVEAMPEVKE